MLVRGGGLLLLLALWASEATAARPSNHQRRLGKKSSSSASASSDSGGGSASASVSVSKKGSADSNSASKKSGKKEKLSGSNKENNKLSKKSGRNSQDQPGTDPDESTPAPVPPVTPSPTVTEVVPDETMMPTVADMDGSTQTVWDVITAQPERFSTFIEAASLVGMDSYYMAEGDKTIFVPTDSAFGSVVPSDLLAKYFDIDLWTDSFLYNVVSFHDIPGRVLSTDLVNGTEIFPTGTGGLIQSSLTITLPPPLLSSISMPVSANIVEVDLTASNGVVHVVDQVLTSTLVRVNAVEAAVATGLFEVLLELVTLTGLVDVFIGPGPFTLFAPPDEVFNAYGEDFINGLREDVNGTREILLNHVITDFVLPCCTNVTGVYENAAGYDLDIVDLGSSEGYVINGVGTAPGLSDLLVSNGKISVVTNILLPPSP